jgi:hypothetical protein
MNERVLPVVANTGYYGLPQRWLLRQRNRLSVRSLGFGANRLTRIESLKGFYWSWKRASGSTLRKPCSCISGSGRKPSDLHGSRGGEPGKHALQMMKGKQDSSLRKRQRVGDI